MSDRRTMFEKALILEQEFREEITRLCAENERLRTRLGDMEHNADRQTEIIDSLREANVRWAESDVGMLQDRCARLEKLLERALPTLSFRGSHVAREIEAVLAEGQP